MPDCARISSSLISAPAFRSSFSTNIRSTLALKALASGRFRNRNTAAASRISDDRGNAKGNHAVARLQRLSSGGSGLRHSVSFPPVLLAEYGQHAQQRPALRGQPRRNSPAASGGVAVAADLRHAIVQPQGVILLGLVIGIAVGLRGTRGTGKNEKGQDELFHDVPITARLGRIFNIAGQDTLASR